MDDKSRLEELNSRNEVVTTDARTAIQSAILINGGAVAALLAFVGSQSEKSKLAVDPTGIRHALFAFAVGVAIAGLCTATGYLANFSYLIQAQSIYEQNLKKQINRFETESRSIGLRSAYLQGRCWPSSLALSWQDLQSRRRSQGNAYYLHPHASVGLA